MQALCQLLEQGCGVWLFTFTLGLRLATDNSCQSVGDGLCHMGSVVTGWVTCCVYGDL